MAIRIEIDENNEYLVHIPDDGEPKRLFWCPLHGQNVTDIPYGEEWPGATKDWVMQWQPLTTQDETDKPTSSNPTVRERLELTKDRRSDSVNGFQATIDRFQLYTFIGNDNEGAVWELFAPVGKDDRFGLPTNGRLPARGP